MRKTLLNNLTAKKLFTPLALLFCLFVIISCKKSGNQTPVDPAIVNPETDFEYVKDPNDAFKFTFKNLSKKYTKVEWRFGDDTLTTAINPTHVYLAPGKYVVDLKTFSETGTTSRKQVAINIVADSVLTFGVERTSTLNQVKFNATAKAPIASVLWTFGDVSPAVTTSETSPTRSYSVGTFNSVTATVKTTNGSTVSFTRTNVTPQGLVQDITQSRASYTVSADNSLSTTENSTKLFDNSTETKFTMGGKDGRLFTYPLLATVLYNTPQTVLMYAISNSNDLPARDPKTWRVEASNDGTTWEVLDSQTMTKNFYDQKTAAGAKDDTQKFKQLFYYAIPNPKPFKQYRLSIGSNWGDAALQINEFRLYK